MTRRQRTPRSASRQRALALAVLALAIPGAAVAHAQAGRTNGQATITAGPPLDPLKPGFATLAPGPPVPRLVRQLPRARAQPGRSARRRSLAYFAAIADFQLADEESPARIEQVDRLPGGLYSWRPQEALAPQVIDAALRQLGSFAARSPNRGRRGARARMDFGLFTGDQSDNAQLNETVWARTLIEGGTIDPNSGTGDLSGCRPVDRAALAGRPADESARYTGVQDYSDYEGGNGSPDFYDPDRPAGAFAQWPAYPGLMDRAQRPFYAAGLRRPDGSPVPTYVTGGNHETGVQGNAAATPEAQAIATGCFKPFSTNPRLRGPADAFTMSEGFAVPPDPARRFIGRAELKAVYGSGSQRDGHGFGYVDPAQDAASAGTAGYYAWDPKPGLRFIALDTSSEGAAATGSPQGNIDDPQWRWLLDQLRRARRDRRLVVLFGHHPIKLLTSTAPDETAGACGATVAGCDADPRGSSPVHVGSELARLLNANENVIAYVSGHSHNNRVLPCGSAAGCPKRGPGNWWEIQTGSAIDWPQQQRLVEVMDNRDGTASIIATPVDGSAPTAIPAAGTDAGAMGEGQLASLGRAFAYNDPQRAGSATGSARDRNVELIVKDPRQGRGAGTCARASRSPAGTRVDRALLGRRRATLRRAYPVAALAKRAPAADSFCLVGGGTVRAVYSRGRTVALLSSRTTQRLRGLRPGSAERSVRRRLRGVRAIGAGSSRWYVFATASARGLVRVRRGKVAEVGLATRRSAPLGRRAAARAALKRLLRAAA